MKNLGIISDCIHARLPDGRVGSKNHVLVRQIEELAKYFDTVTIIYPFENYNTEVKYFSYSAPNIQFIESRVVGGTSLKAKLDIIKILPFWFSLYKQLWKKSDIIYMRFPNNISIPAFFYFRLKGAKMFATYTGSWDYDPYTSFSYRLQKMILRLYFNGPVMVYRQGDKEYRKIKNSFSPSYTESVWYEEIENVKERKERLLKNGIKELRLIVIGALTENKNQRYIFQSCEMLKEAGIPFVLTIVGAGKSYNDYKHYLEQHKLENEIILAGPKNYMEVRELLRQNDFLVHASLSEGFAKVPIEAMFHGCIPVLGNKILLVRKFLQKGENGFMFNTDEKSALTDICIKIYKDQPMQQLVSMIDHGRNFVSGYTLEKWAAHYTDILKDYFG